MFPLLSLVVSGVTLLQLILLRERAEEMNEETKKKLEEIKTNQLAAAEAQAATSDAVDNIVEDIKSLDAKIVELGEKLADAIELEPEEQALLDEVVSGSAALNTAGTALKEKAEAAAAIVADAPEVPTEG